MRIKYVFSLILFLQLKNISAQKMKSVYVYVIGYEYRQEQFDHIDYVRHYSIFCSSKFDIRFYNHDCYNSQVNFILNKGYDRYYFKDDKLLNTDGETRSLILKKDSSETDFNTNFNLSSTFLKLVTDKLYSEQGRFLIVFKAQINAIYIGQSKFRICNDSVISQKKYYKCFRKLIGSSKEALD